MYTSNPAASADAIALSQDPTEVEYVSVVLMLMFCTSDVVVLSVLNRPLEGSDGEPVPL